MILTVPKAKVNVFKVLLLTVIVPQQSLEATQSNFQILITFDKFRTLKTIFPWFFVKYNKSLVIIVTLLSKIDYFTPTVYMQGLW